MDVQIGFTVFLDVPQEMRSRLWLVLIQEPALAVPFQVLSPCASKIACDVPSDYVGSLGHAGSRVALRRTCRAAMCSRVGQIECAVICCGFANCEHEQLSWAGCVQELGRFPDLGSFTAAAPSVRGSEDRASPAPSPTETPSAHGAAWATTPAESRDGSARRAHGDQEPSTPQHPGDAPAQIARAAGATSRTDAASVSATDVELELPAAQQAPSAAEGASPSGASPSGASRASRGMAALTESHESALADISDACSEDVMTQSRQAGASSAAVGDIVRGGELGPDDSSPTLEQSALPP